MKKTKVAIVGGGFAGCCAADQFNFIPGSWDVHVFERGELLGAGNRTRHFAGHPYTFGPRHFLTQFPETFDYLNRIVPLRSCADHEFKTFVEQDSDFYNYPINYADIDRMPDRERICAQVKDCAEHPERLQGVSNLEDYWRQSVGELLFRKMIDGYNKKMWQVESCKEIDTFKWSPKGVAIKDGPRAAWDSAISAYPIALNGYDDFFDYAVRNAQVHYRSPLDRYDVSQGRLYFQNFTFDADIVINTVGPDTFLGLSSLPYFSRNLQLLVLPVEFALPENVYFVYYAGNEPFTRVVEYKKFTRYVSPHTLLSMEYVTQDGRQDYPSPFAQDQLRAREYLKAMGKKVFSIGRAGSYLYGIDIDDCIRQAMLMRKSIIDGEWGYAVPGDEYDFPELRGRPISAS